MEMGKRKWLIMAGVLFMLGLSGTILFGNAAKRGGDFENALVTDFSDQGMRVGNNVYGYLDVPEGFGLETGSFNPANTDYAGIRDGQQHGIWLYNGDHTGSIWISTIDAETHLEYYIGFGMGEEVLYGKGKYRLTAEKVWEKLADKIFEYMGEIALSDISVMSGELINIGGMDGESLSWEYKIGNNKYNSVLYLLEDPDNRKRLHCISATFQGDEEKYMRSLRSYALEREPKDQTSGYMAAHRKRIRLGGADIGYLSLPDSYEKGSDTSRKLAWWERFGYMHNKNMLLEKDSHLVSYLDIDEAETQKSGFKDVAVLGVFRNSELFSRKREAYLDANLTEFFGNFGFLDYYETANLVQYQGNMEFNADFFVSVIESCLGKYGTVNTNEVTVDGKSGYLCTWEGKYPDYTQGSVHFYILNDGEGVVRMIGIGQNQGGEELLKCLETYTMEK